MFALPLWLRIALPALAIGGAWYAGDIMGNHEGANRTTDKYRPAMERAQAAMKITAANIRRARAEAAAADLANARRVELAQANASQETASEYQIQLAAARAAAADYARRLRAPAGGGSAAGGGGGAAGRSGLADATGRPVGGSSLPELDNDDLLICTENTVKVIGWKAWWKKVSAIPR